MNNILIGWGVAKPPDPEALQKALDSGESAPMYMEGFITTNRRDHDGHIIVQDGIDWSEFDASPVFHWTHPYHSDKVVGRMEGQRQMREEGGVSGNYVKVRLTDELPLARDVFARHKAMCKSHGGGLGFSVEGRIISIDPQGNITKCKVSSVAIDHSPRNPDAFAIPLAASLTGAGMLNPATVRRLSLASHLSDMELLAALALKQQPSRSWEEGLAFVNNMRG